MATTAFLCDNPFMLKISIYPIDMSLPVGMLTHACTRTEFRHPSPLISRTHPNKPHAVFTSAPSYPPFMLYAFT